MVVGVGSFHSPKTTPNLTTFMPLLLAELTWSTGWWMACLVMFAIVAGVLWWGYGGTPVAGQVRFAAIGLKLGGFALLALCLLEPLWRDRSAKPGANQFAVVVDDSRSLQIRESADGPTRGENLQASLRAGAGEGGWLESLESFFQVRQYRSGDRLTGLKDFAELDFNSPSSSLSGSLQNLQRRFEGRPLAGVLLFTDGGATDLAGDIDFSTMPPIFPVLPGTGQVPADLAIGGVQMTQSQFEDSPVTIEAQVRARGMVGHEVTVKLSNEEGKEVAREVHVFQEGEASWGARFRFRPEKPGLSFYQLEATRLTSPDKEATPIPEATLVNNRRTVAVDRGTGPFRILYVSGRPNWEFKFLRRALQEEEELDLVGLIRIAKKEARFDFRGRTGESSNPLFRGFEKQEEEETEQYDESVLIRINTRDANELVGGFPKEAEELFAYHAVIVDDLESAFFKTLQQTLLEEFVNRRGGGFMMLGGLESFGEGGYARTPIGSMLPVYLHSDGPGRPAEYRWKLTREGWLMPWARLRSSEVEERKTLGKVPFFRVLNPSSGIKPGAVAVAGVSERDEEEPQPALIGHRFGKGRVMALTVGDLWRWGQAEPELQEDMAQFWRQALRRLVADVPERVSIEIKKAGTLGSQAVSLEVRAADKEFNPLGNVMVKLSITHVDGEKVGLDAEPSAKEAGLFHVSFLPREPGAYRVLAEVLDEHGVQVGKAESGWVADFEAEEFQSLEFNREFLETLAHETGGEVVPLDKLDDLAKRLPDLEAPVMEVWSRPLWHSPWVFLCALGLFGAEWILRRMKGLP